MTITIVSIMSTTSLWQVFSTPSPAVSGRVHYYTETETLTAVQGLTHLNVVDLPLTLYYNPHHDRFLTQQDGLQTPVARVALVGSISPTSFSDSTGSGEFLEGAIVESHVSLPFLVSKTDSVAYDIIHRLFTSTMQNHEATTQVRLIGSFRCHHGETSSCMCVFVVREVLEVSRNLSGSVALTSLLERNYQERERLQLRSQSERAHLSVPQHRIPKRRSLSDTVSVCSQPSKRSRQH